ncbi:MAG TPA: hypothetical protein VJ926_03275 [Patescibacteria group bacterium]|nr:hypothetical protein [Patescibacteria group bacterium]
MKQKTRWYVEPQDSHTNSVLQRELNGAEHVYLKNNRGEPFLAYEVAYAFITNLKKSRNDLQLKFKVYRKQGENSLAREFDFSFLSKKKKK